MRMTTKWERRKFGDMRASYSPERAQFLNIMGRHVVTDRCAMRIETQREDRTLIVQKDCHLPAEEVQTMSDVKCSGTLVVLYSHT